MSVMNFGILLAMNFFYSLMIGLGSLVKCNFHASKVLSIIIIMGAFFSELEHMV